MGSGPLRLSRCCRRGFGPNPTYKGSRGWAIVKVGEDLGGKCGRGWGLFCKRGAIKL